MTSLSPSPHPVRNRGSGNLTPDNPTHRSLSKEDSDSKSRAILKATSANPPDITFLRSQCISAGGLVSSAVRYRVWPLLANIDPEDLEFVPSSADVHASSEQVQLDVNRSFWRFPKGIRSFERSQLRSRISKIIDKILASDPHLHYYQGFHEICSVLMLTCGDTVAHALASVLCHCHLSDYLAPSMEMSVAHCEVMFAVIATVDRELHAHMQQAGTVPHFSISWILTWFAHDVNDIDTISRVYDACIVDTCCIQLISHYIWATDSLKPRHSMCPHFDPLKSQWDI
eukprot:m.322742 g.322742  ORF g.322742 m.322742 type:complete len:285 (+) comp20357_c0_seq10:291-1145(+)